jgi:predicted DNA-binding transcriptional regulator AlpA
MASSTSITDKDRLLTEVQAADLLRLSTRTLQAWRSQRVGPPFVRAGRAIRYDRSALVAWTTDNTVTPQRLADQR